MARIAITTQGANAVVELDGHEISNAIAGYTLHHNVNGLPEITLDVVAVEHTTEAGDAVVHIPDATAELLRRLGWTPPGKEN